MNFVAVLGGRRARAEGLEKGGQDQRWALEGQSCVLTQAGGMERE